MPEQTVHDQDRSGVTRRVTGHVQDHGADLVIGLIGIAALIGAALTPALLTASALTALAAGCGGLMTIRNS